MKKRTSPANTCSCLNHIKMAIVHTKNRKETINLDELVFYRIVIKMGKHKICCSLASKTCNIQEEIEEGKRKKKGGERKGRKKEKNYLIQRISIKVWAL